VIGLDTNVLVRFLVEDDERQSAAAAALVDRAIAARQELFVSSIVICELVWVLSASYRVPKARVLSLLRELMRARHLAFGAPDQLLRALDAFAAGKGDFADYLIREECLARGCESVHSFDRVLLREGGFEGPG
jgi:predicted nucleic-acid-binding protein